ncbi:hypothetical protein Taro_047206 [Colocasia esculenta]|uniref:CS domain-containing protein n=1 Tax=Colocasia esculenta TaxID=4460 RepID=A0A843X6X3_COLES|nr:hypothetical protein [Colocasia esculenta]
MAAALSSAVSASLRSHRMAHTLPLPSNSACCFSCLDAGKSRFPSQKCRLPARCPRILRRPGSVSSRGLSEAAPRTTNYEVRCTTSIKERCKPQFSDGVAEVELRLDLVATNVQSPRDIVVDVDGSSLRVRIQNSGSLVTIFETSHLYEKIMPSETIWFIDEEQLVINLKKYDANLKWPDIMETWDCLTRGLVQLLKGTSIYIVGESTEINQKVAGALASGLGRIAVAAVQAGGGGGSSKGEQQRWLRLRRAAYAGEASDNLLSFFASSSSSRSGRARERVGSGT